MKDIIFFEVGMYGAMIMGVLTHDVQWTIIAFFNGLLAVITFVIHNMKQN